MDTAEKRYVYNCWRAYAEAVKRDQRHGIACSLWRGATFFYRLNLASFQWNRLKKLGERNHRMVWFKLLSALWFFSFSIVVPWPHGNVTRFLVSCYNKTLELRNLGRIFMFALDLPNFANCPQIIHRPYCHIQTFSSFLFHSLLLSCTKLIAITLKNNIFIPCPYAKNINLTFLAWWFWIWRKLWK